MPRYLCNIKYLGPKSIYLYPFRWLHGTTYFDLDGSEPNLSVYYQAYLFHMPIYMARTFLEPAGIFFC